MGYSVGAFVGIDAEAISIVNITKGTTVTGVTADVVVTELTSFTRVSSSGALVNINAVVVVAANHSIRV